MRYPANNGRMDKPQEIQCSPFIRLCLGSIKLNRVISELCYKGATLHSAILLIFNKLPFVAMTFVLSIFGWPF